MTTQLTDVDRDAIKWAIAVVRRESPARRKQIDAKLRNEPWEAVGRFCALGAQIESLGLQPCGNQPWSTPIRPRPMRCSNADRCRAVEVRTRSARRLSVSKRSLRSEGRDAARVATAPPTSAARRVNDATALRSMLDL